MNEESEEVRTKIECLGLTPSFGFGDRIGSATPGHVAAMKEAGGSIAPIFVQQSIREMARTNRTPQNVVDDALRGMDEAGWDGPNGADADHLKTPEDVDRTVEVGFAFFTIDPSDHVDQQADDYDEATLRSKFAEVADDVAWFDAYADKRIALSTGSVIELTEEARMRAAVKYGRAIDHALSLAEYIKQTNESAGHDYEIELSVDETDQPTTLAEHWIIADQCLTAGVGKANAGRHIAPTFQIVLLKFGDAGYFRRRWCRSERGRYVVRRTVGFVTFATEVDNTSEQRLVMSGGDAQRFQIRCAGSLYVESTLGRPCQCGVHRKLIRSRV